MYRRQALSLLLAMPSVGAWAASPGVAPDGQPLRLVVAAPAGGITDVFARLLAEPLRVTTGQTVIVENRPGASGAIAAKAVMQSPADGKTLYFATPTSLTLPTLVKQPPPFDAQKDFTAVGMVAGGDGVLVVPADLPVRSIEELVAHVRAKPGQLNYGSAGIASTNHLSMALFLDRLGLDAVHVPYTGGAPAVTALLAGQTQLYMGDLVSLGPHLRSGKLKALAQIGLKRSPQFPDVPTLAETVLPGYRATFWLGFMAKAGTPPAMISQLNESIRKALENDQVRQQAAASGFVLHGGPPQELARQINSDLEVWGALVRKHRITAQ